MTALCFDVVYEFSRNAREARCGVCGLAPRTLPQPDCLTYGIEAAAATFRNSRKFSLVQSVLFLTVHQLGFIPFTSCFRVVTFDLYSPSNCSFDRHPQFSGAQVRITNSHKTSYTSTEKLIITMSLLANPPEGTVATMGLAVDGSNGVAKHLSSGISAGKLCHYTVSYACLRCDYYVLTCHTQTRLLYMTARSDCGVFKRKRR
jgi:hypothetical protein